VGVALNFSDRHLNPLYLSEEIGHKFRIVRYGRFFIYIAFPRLKMLSSLGVFIQISQSVDHICVIVLLLLDKDKLRWTPFVSRVSTELFKFQINSK
jgi:hypothetical protein